MADRTLESPHQKDRTEGLTDTMSRPGRVFRAIIGAIRWCESLNRKYARDGNLPVYDNATFPWAKDVEAEWTLIRRELDRLLLRKDELPGFHEIAKEVSNISTDRNWKTFMITGYGHTSAAAIAACPETWRILQKIPGLKAAMFSIFEPGKHLPPHRGPYNGVLRFHLGLIVPKAEKGRIGIRVADRTCYWEEGKALIFDDAFEHEAWNYSDEVRVVLFVDFVKPLRFPARFFNWLLLNIAIFTPFIREGYKAQKNWEKRFFGDRKYTANGM
ncbi:MAG TPA: aspartyl/asparaginyl beta-hydroxylase domain-containing protein [Bauldia sp.]|nr:aspartyl/asparaginyl beta-hydroxylase domain-containing protein [Bauldia sp.]